MILRSTIDLEEHDEGQGQRQYGEEPDEEQLKKEQQRLVDDIDRYFAEAERIDKEEDEIYGEENDGFSLPAHLRDRKMRREHIREGLRQMKEEE